jgi:hypothetical protein
VVPDCGTTPIARFKYKVVAGCGTTPIAVVGKKWVVGKKCNPNRKLTEMSRTGNLLLLISSLILRCFSKTFSFIVYFYIDYNKMSKYNQKVERCSFLISWSVKCVTRTGNLLLLISSLILRCFAKTFSSIVHFYILETHRL